MPGLDSVLGLGARLRAVGAGGEKEREREGEGERKRESGVPGQCLLGTCMSGAGPSVLALSLAGHDHDRQFIADQIKALFFSLLFSLLFSFLFTF